jgi:hypothetical protein
MISALPAPQTSSPLPSRTAAARDRALLARGKTAYLRGELTSSNTAAVEPLLRDALERLGLDAAAVSDPSLAEAALAGAIHGYRAVADQVLSITPVPALPPSPANPIAVAVSSERQSPPAPPTASSPTPSAAGSAALSPDTPLSMAFAEYRKAKKIDESRSARAERDVETTIRLFTELVGNVPLRGLTREQVSDFRSALADICSD